MTVDVNYFINKFEAIPEEFWYVGGYVSPFDHRKKCALGHCCTVDDWMFDAMEALQDLLVKNLGRPAGGINDGKDVRYQQPTPKQRILAALYDVRTMLNQGLDSQRSVATEDQSELQKMETKRKLLPPSTEFYKIIEETSDCKIKAVSQDKELVNDKHF